MKQKILLSILFSIIIISALSKMGITPSIINPANAEPKTWIVDDDGTADFTIQEAINAAGSGDTIMVLSGTYHENVNVTKTVALIGEDKNETIIDGGYTGNVIRVISSNVKIVNFTIQNSGNQSENSGIFLFNALNVTISNNTIKNNLVGVNLRSRSNNTLIIDNLMLNNLQSGIEILGNSNFNHVISNTLTNNTRGVKIDSSSFNTLYRNNFINNTKDYQARVFGGSGNKFDNGAEGNYWSDYHGADDGSPDPRTGEPRFAGDGIGDTELPACAVNDYAPLIEPWSIIRKYLVNSQVVNLCCNYTVGSFKFNQTEKQISFFITGPTGWKGFCNVTVPKALLSPNTTALEGWVVMLGSNPVTNATITTIDDSTLISFNYTLGSNPLENRVRLKIVSYYQPIYPPTASFQYLPTIATITAPVFFNDTSVSPNGTIISRLWNFGDGNTTITNATYFTHQFNQKGLFNVSLTVKDDKNGTDSITKTLFVSNINPVANFTFSPSHPKAKENINFLGNISRDDDGHVVQWLWNFGDGTSSNETNIMHAYQHAETYTVILTVWDDDKASNSTSKIVVVEKGTTSIEIGAPEVVKANRNFTIVATLYDYASRPIEGERIVFYFDGEYLANATTDFDGGAVISVRLSVVGTYQIKAEYTGSSCYFGSNVAVDVIFDPLNTTLAVNAPEDITQNEVATFYGTLKDEYGNAMYSATIRFYIYNGSSWEEIGDVSTNQSGIASINYTPQQIGQFKLKAVFEGTSIYFASESNEASFSVVTKETPKETDYRFYIIATIAIVVIVIGAIIIWKRKQKP